ncbi:MAG: P-loop NTPase fold protein, partial [Nitrososphaeraceae archaeon]
MGKDSSDDSNFLVDLPITIPSEDEFKQSYFVDILEDRIIHVVTPTNIGLYGSWGIGKSSILNLLKNRLETKKELKEKYLYLYVDAWKLSKAYFRQELLVELNSLLGAFKNDVIEDK